MKKSLFLVLAVVLMGLLILPSCSGGGSSGGGTPDPPPAPAEANLAVTLSPANGSVQPPALPPFPLTVTITSTMPPSGVRIEITAKKDDGSGAAAYFSTNVTSTAATNNFTITGTPVGVQCLVEVKVTSLTKATNVWTGSYRYTSK
ncbi:MAG: hypothetical protein ABW019_07385 [Chitinophagaceae bacterium]